MGFLEYAWTVSLQKDHLKLKITMDPLLNQPTLATDSVGFTLNLPTPRVSDDERVSFLGYVFPLDATGKAEVGKLLRAAVLHITTQTLLPVHKEKIAPQPSSEYSKVFAQTLASNVLVNAYIQNLYPDRLFDVAYANALAFSKIKPAQRILTPSTRIMAALLSKVNMDTVKGVLSPELEKTVNDLVTKLMTKRGVYVVTRRRLYQRGRAI